MTTIFLSLFELGLSGGAHLNPFYWRNDYADIEQWSRSIRDGYYAYHRELHKQHQAFAELWDKTCGSKAR